MACLSPGRRLLPFALLVGLAVPARAQLPPLTVPRGQIRLDFSGGFADWSERYRDGRKEQAAGDFLRDPVDAGWLPELTALETSLGRILGTSPSGLSLGRTRSRLLVNTGTAGIGLAFGLTSRLTIFGTVPFVRVRVQNTFDLDSAGSTLGLNPAHPVFGTVGGQTQAGTLLAELDLVLAELQTRIQAGFYDADPPTKAVAEATLLRGADIRAELGGLLTGGTAVFLPTLTSATGIALTTTIEDLRTTFTTTLSIPGFVTAVPLPATQTSSGEFLDVATRPGGPYEFRPFPEPVITQLGDVEVGAAYRWLESVPEGGGLAVRSVLMGTVRLGTAYLDRPDRLFDVSTGDHQTDVQADLVTDLQAGRLGLRLTGRYVRQLAGEEPRRVTPPDQPLAGSTLLATLEHDPGDIVEVGVEPFYRIAPTLALVTGVRWWSKGEDTWTYAAGSAPIPGVDAGILGAGSSQRAFALSGGISYVHSGLGKDGIPRLPMDASLRYERVVSSSEGIVPRRQAVTALIRFYRRLF